MVLLVKNFLSLDADVLCQKLLKNLEKGKKIVLDFVDLKNVSSEFLEGSIGKVLKEHSFQSIQHKIIFKTINKDIMAKLKIIIKNS